MPKPTLSIGGTMTVNDARQLADLLAQIWCPPIAVSEGEDYPVQPLDGDDEPAWKAYLQAMHRAAGDLNPFRVGSWERNDNPLYEIVTNGIEEWLIAREDRIAWRIWRPAGRDEDGCLYNGSIKVAGLGAPDCARNVRCPIDSEGDPFVHLVDRDERNWVLEARENLAIFDFHPPALVIKG